MLIWLFPRSTNILNDAIAESCNIKSLITITQFWYHHFHIYSLFAISSIMIEKKNYSPISAISINQIRTQPRRAKVGSVFWNVPSYF